MIGIVDCVLYHWNIVAVDRLLFQHVFSSYYNARTDLHSGNAAWDFAGLLVGDDGGDVG